MLRFSIELFYVPGRSVEHKNNDVFKRTKQIILFIFSSYFEYATKITVTVI